MQCVIMNGVGLADTAFGIGAGLELLGLVVAAIGFHATWREFSTGGRLFEHEIGWLERAARPVARLTRRLLRWERKTTFRAGAEAVTVTESAYVNRTSEDIRLPSLVDNPERFADVVAGQIRRLHDRMNTEMGRLDREVQARETADHQLRNDFEAKVAAVEGLSRHVAVGGLRTQIYGWSFVLLGVVLQAVATPFV